MTGDEWGMSLFSPVFLRIFFVGLPLDCWDLPALPEDLCCSVQEKSDSSAKALRNVCKAERAKFCGRLIHK